MARYIDADLLRNEMEALHEHHLEMKNFCADGAVSDCLYFLDNAPTADVVEVVRCKDCQWATERTRANEIFQYQCCNTVAGRLPRRAVDYCSYGARKGVTDTNVGGK